ncbi:MAG: glycosyltransferase family 1 protein [Lachnospiraceae bacterium]|nr:glycosyltransferase family 1 protein [Lachnospiraceae bacterium]
MSQPMIVLHVVGRLDIGGAESRIMDLYRNIDREKVQFVFCQHTSDRCAFEEEVESLGGKVYHVPRFNVKNYFTYKKAWEAFFRQHPEIKVVHGHMTSTASIYLPIAKKMGVRTTIAHARSAGVDPGLKGKLTTFLRKNLYKKCDYRFTCSNLAGEAVFGNQKDVNRKARFIPNAIAVDQFAFDDKQREQVRKELGIEDNYVIGHVGRFAPMKNHKYMLKILEQCVKLEEENSTLQVKMLFLGDGNLREEIQSQAVEMGLESRVLMLGNKKDVYRYYQAMDYFLLPSFYEGLPGTAIEAQASGLPGIMSDTVTEEAVVTDLLQRRSIEEEPIFWAKEIWKEYLNSGAQKRGMYAQVVKEASFDVKEQAKKMLEFYITGEW